MRGPLFVDVQTAAEAPLTMAALILARIKAEMRATKLAVQPSTQQRRRRALRTPQVDDRTGPRYPAGYQPNPTGPYGHDSGYLYDSIRLNVEKGKADVFAGIPKSRQKAAFIMRRIAPTAADELPAAVQTTTIEFVKTIVRKTIAKAVRKELRGMGVSVSVK